MKHLTPLALLGALGAASCSSLAPGARPLQDSAETGARGPWYATLSAGLNVADDGAFDPASGPSSSGEGTYDTGFGTGFAVGYEFSDALAAELEYTYRSNDIDSIDGNAGNIALGGDYASVAVLANLVYSFPSANRWRPYVGLGAGVLQEVDADLDSSGLEASDRGVFAYQLKAGAGYRVTDALELLVEGRYLGSSGPELDVEGTAQSFDADYDNFGVFLGGRWSF
jgi:opacity protein-like surface antigen